MLILYCVSVLLSVVGKYVDTSHLLCQCPAQCGGEVCCNKHSLTRGLPYVSGSNRVRTTRSLVVPRCSTSAVYLSVWWGSMLILRCVSAAQCGGGKRQDRRFTMPC